MRQFLDRVFNAVGYLAGIFMVGTLLAVLTSIAGRLVPVLDLPGAKRTFFDTNRAYVV